VPAGLDSVSYPKLGAWVIEQRSALRLDKQKIDAALAARGGRGGPDDAADGLGDSSDLGGGGGGSGGASGGGGAAGGGRNGRRVAKGGNGKMAKLKDDKVINAMLAA
jgi:hypothetical protein